MDKATLLATIQSERADLDALLAKLSPEQMCQTMTDSQWSIKDVLAHLAAWERRCVTWIEAGLHGETPERPAPGFKWEDLDRLNEQTFLENRDLPLDDVQAISRQAYEQLVTTVQALS